MLWRSDTKDIPCATITTYSVKDEIGWVCGIGHDSNIMEIRMHRSSPSVYTLTLNECSLKSNIQAVDNI